MREADIDRNNVIQETARDTSKNKAYKQLPSSVSTSSSTTLSLYKGGAAYTSDGTCKLVAIYS